MFARIDVHKEQNISSFGVVSEIRKIMKIRRCGHNGTLDPMATGVLSVYIGKATTFIDRLRTPMKRYIGTLRFGYASDTLDIWGNVEAVPGDIPSLEDIEDVLPAFRGEIEQTPPMVSAIKVKGKPLYQYARDGKEIERKSRKVKIEELTCLSFDGAEVTFSVRCSKGTYIRTLFSDLARELGTSGIMSQLKRVENDGIRLEDCYTLREIASMKEKEDFRFLRAPGELQPFYKKDISLSILEKWRQGIKTPISAGSDTEDRIILMYQGKFTGTAIRKGEYYLPEKVI